MGASRENVTSNNSSECILDALKPTVFLRGAKQQRIGVVKPGAKAGRGDGLSHISVMAERIWCRASPECDRMRNCRWS